jgi:hemolysin activation/secretion protein
MLKFTNIVSTARLYSLCSITVGALAILPFCAQVSWAAESQAADPITPTLDQDPANLGAAPPVLLAAEPVPPAQPGAQPSPQSPIGDIAQPQPLMNAEALTTPVLTITPGTPAAPAPPTLSQASPIPETIAASKIEVTGVTALKPAEINAILAPLQGRTVSREELQKAIAAINDLYLKRGFITSRVYLDETSLGSSTVRLKAVEGGIESIQVEGNQRLRTSYIVDRLERGARQPLNINTLETELRFLRANPIFESVEASLKAGTNQGQSILTVKVRESKRFGFDFGVDNYVPPSISPDRAFVALSYRNLSGIGDQISFSYAAGLNFASLEHSANFFAFNYRVPINSRDGTLELQGNWQNNRITEEGLDIFGIEGRSEFYQLTYRQPIFRNLRQEFALSLGVSAQGGQTFLFNDTPFGFGIGPDENGVSRTRVLRFAQEYARRDNGGVWSARSQFNFGLGILDATQNQSPIPDGRFFSWTGQVQRVQEFGKNLLVMTGNVQLTPHGLLPSEQFVIGGVQTVRGYPQNARSGDMGYRFAVEGRIPLLQDKFAAKNLQILPFAEVGQVFNQADNPNQIPGPSLLGSVGMGVLWQPIQDLGLRFDYGIPLIDLGQDRNRSLQDRGFNFSLKVGFQF